MKKFFIPFIFVPTCCWAFLSPPQYISLLPNSAYDFRDKAPDLNKICIGKDHKIDEKFYKCIKDHTLKKTWELSVYEKPEEKSKILGKIIVTSEKGGQIYAEYKAKEKEAVPFPNDPGSFNPETMTFFLYTVSDVKGDWVQLPRRPFPKPVWINLQLDWPEEETRGIHSWSTGHTYHTKKIGNFIALSFDKDRITYRKQNCEDVECDESEYKPVTEKDRKPIPMPLKDLYDSDGHLLAWPAY